MIGPHFFERALGEELHLELAGAEGRVSNLEGMLLAVQLEAVVLKTIAGNVTVPFEQIRVGKKTVRW